MSSETANGTESLESLRAEFFNLREKIARTNLVRNVGKIKIPFPDTIGELVNSFEKVVVVDLPIYDEIQNLTPNLKYAHGGNINCQICITGQGYISDFDGNAPYSEEYALNMALRDYATMTSQEFRNKRDDYWKSLEETDYDSDEQAEHKWNSYEEEFMIQNEPRLLKELNGRFATCLEKITSSES